MGYSFGHRWTRDEDALFDTMSDAEVAAAVGITPAAAKSRRNRLHGKTYHIDSEDRSQLLKLVKQAAWQDRVLEAIRDAAAKPLKPLPQVKYAGGGEREFMLQLSDLQYGEHLTVQQSGGLGRYSSELAEERLSMLADKVLAVQERERVKRLNIATLGDMVEGTTIYASQAFYTDKNVVEQTIDGGRAVAQFIRKVSTGFDEVVVDSVLGNHGRIDKAMPVNSNMDVMLMKYAEALIADVKNVRMRVHEKTWYAVVERFGKRYLLVHGDDVTLSLEGFKREVRRWRDLVGQVDTVLIGHHHTSIVTKSLIVNGSFVGPSEFSLKNMREGGDATQNLLTVGRVGVEVIRPLSLETDARRAKTFKD